MSSYRGPGIGRRRNRSRSQDVKVEPVEDENKEQEAQVSNLLSAEASTSVDDEYAVSLPVKKRRRVTFSDESTSSSAEATNANDEEAGSSQDEADLTIKNQENTASLDGTVSTLQRKECAKESDSGLEKIMKMETEINFLRQLIQNQDSKHKMQLEEMRLTILEVNKALNTLNKAFSAHLIREKNDVNHKDTVGITPLRKLNATDGGCSTNSGVKGEADKEPKSFTEMFRKVIILIGNRRLLNRVELIKCRLVCKDVKQGVDEFWSDHRNHKILYNAVAFPTFKCLSILRGQLPRGRAIFSDPLTEPRFYKPVEQILLDFPEQNPVQDQDRPNPFPSRHLILNLQTTCRNIECVRFRYLFAAVLARFGQELWYLSIYASNSKFYNFYESLCDWVQLMPNLKVLVLDCDWSDKELILQLEESVKIRKFPKLEKLEVFQACNVLPLVEAVISENKHIEKLAIVKSGLNNPVSSPWLVKEVRKFTTQLSNLNELSMQVATWFDEEMLTNFQLPKLQTLNILLNTEDQLKLLKKFKGVRFLRINYFNQAQRNNIHVELPELQEMEIRNWILADEPLLNLNWLLPLYRLRYLKIAIKSATDAGEIIDHASFVCRFVKSEAMKSLPALRAIDIICEGKRIRYLI